MNFISSSFLKYYNIVLSVSVVISSLITIFDINDLRKYTIITPGILLCLSLGFFIIEYLVGVFKKDEGIEYIRNSHQRIWIKLCPNKDYVFNNFAAILFYLGKYDDGSDKRLNLYKKRMKKRSFLLVWPFVLFALSFAPILYVTLTQRQ